MPRIQTFISNDVESEIMDIIQMKISQGATKSEANLSSTVAMLIELGVRVYNLQSQKKEGGFSQLEFNKIILENIMKTSFICQRLIGINSYNTEIQNIPVFQFNEMAEEIKDDIKEVLGKFFPSDSNEESDN